MDQIDGAIKFSSPGGNELDAILVEPVPVTRDNLSVVVDAGWIDQETLCQGVADGPAPCN